jgi:hypothetical protein
VFPGAGIVRGCGLWANPWPLLPVPTKLERLGERQMRIYQVATAARRWDAASSTLL